MKILEQYNKYKIIPASKNIIYHWVTRERLKNFGNLNKDKIFYVIRSIDDESKFYIGPKNNLLANYFYVLSHLQYAIKNKWIPIIDQKNYPVYNKVPCLINGTMNAWEYFWQQPSNYKLEEVYASKNVVLSKRNWFSEWDMGYDASKYLNKNVINFFYQLTKMVPLNFETQLLVNEKKKLICENTLGVSFRFGGHSPNYYNNKNGHPIQPDIYEMIRYTQKYMSEWNVKHVYLTSDVIEAIKIFKEEFKEKLIYIDRLRYSMTDKKNDISNLYNNNMYKITLDYLIEMELLSKCDFLIGSINSGFRYAVVKNNNKFKNLKVLDYGLLEDKNKLDLGD